MLLMRYYDSSMVNGLEDGEKKRKLVRRPLQLSRQDIRVLTQREQFWVWRMETDGEDAGRRLAWQ